MHYFLISVDTEATNPASLSQEAHNQLTNYLRSQGEHWDIYLRDLPYHVITEKGHSTHNLTADHADYLINEQGLSTHDLTDDNTHYLPATFATAKLLALQNIVQRLTDISPNNAITISPSFSHPKDTPNLLKAIHQRIAKATKQHYPEHQSLTDEHTPINYIDLGLDTLCFGILLETYHQTDTFPFSSRDTDPTLYSAIDLTWRSPKSQTNTQRAIITLYRDLE